MKKKALLVVLSAAVLVAASVFGTMAYLTDVESVTNTFTVGQVHITLDELDYDNSTPGDNDRDTENKYHLLPGHEYVNDPTIHVDSKSEDCWLFVKVENGISEIETKVKAETIAAQMEANGWIPLDGQTNVYAYKETASANENIKVFESFTIDGASVTNAIIADYETATKGTAINVTAYAIQAAGFADAASAWTAANFSA